MRPILKGSTDVSTVIRIVDSSDGTPETGVDGGSPGPSLWYRREGAAKVNFSAVTLASLSASHSDGGIEHISDGYYRVDVPDAAFATGSDGVLIGGAHNDMVVVGAYHQLVDFDLGGTEGVRLRRSLLGVALATVSNGSTTTSVVVNNLDPAASSTDQYLGKVLTFDRNTTTAGLRGCSTRITDFAVGSPDSIFTVDALPTAPQSGDTATVT